MNTHDSHPIVEAPPGRTGAKVYARPGALGLASRPISLILVALLALVAGSLVYYKYVL